MSSPRALSEAVPCRWEPWWPRAHGACVLGVLAAVALAYSHPILNASPWLQGLVVYETVHLKETAFFLGVVLITALTAARFAGANPARSLAMTPLAAPWLLWLCWQAISLYHAPMVAEGAREWQRQLALALWCLALAIGFDRRLLMRVAGAFLVVGAASSAFAVAAYTDLARQARHLALLRAEGLFGHPTILASFETALLTLAAVWLIGLIDAWARARMATGGAFGATTGPRARLARISHQSPAASGCRPVGTAFSAPNVLDDAHGIASARLGPAALPDGPSHALATKPGEIFGPAGAITALLSLAGGALLPSLFPTLHRPWALVALGFALTALCLTALLRWRALEAPAAAPLLSAIPALGALALGAWAMAVSFSRGGVLGLFVATLVIALVLFLRARRLWRERQDRRFPWKRLTLAAMALLVLGAALALLFARSHIPQGELRRVLGVRTEALDNTVRMRTLSFRDCLSYLQGEDGRHFLVGSGLGSFSVWFPRYQSEEFSRISTLRRNYLHHAHNEILETWCETGLIGVLLWGFLLVRVFTLGFQAALRCSEARRRWILLGMVAAMAGLLCDAMVSINFRFLSTPVLFWTFAGILAREARSQTSTTPQSPPSAARSPWRTALFVLMGMAALPALWLIARQWQSQRERFLAESARSVGENEQAFRHFERAIDFDESRAEFQYHAAVTLAASRRVREAFALFERFSRSNPFFIRANYDHGVLAMSLNRREEALMHFEREVALNPYFALSYLRLAELRIAEKRFRQAREALTEYRRLEPLDSYAWRLEGEARQRLGLLDDAARAFERALDLAPGDPVALTNLALVAEAQGLRERAADMAARAVSFERPCAPFLRPLIAHRDFPDETPPERRALARRFEHELAQAAAPDAAGEHVARVINRYLTDNGPALTRMLLAGWAGAQDAGLAARARLGYALLLIRGGWDDDAVQVLEAHLERTPDDARAAFYLGQLYERSETDERALSTYRRAAEGLRETPEVMLALRNTLCRARPRDPALEDLELRMMALGAQAWRFPSVAQLPWATGLDRLPLTDR